jgi:tripartite ATP-independent transporter DctP family solute receptor
MKIHKLLICAAVLLLSAPLHAAEYTMMLSHAGPASDINDDYVGATAIKSYIEEKTGGKVEVEIYPGNQLGNYQEVMEQVQADAVQAVHTSIAGITPFMPELAVLDLQYVIPGDEVVYKLMEGQFFDKMGAAIKEKMSNVVLAAVCDGGRWRSFYTTDKQIKSAADMKGLKIRTINSPLQQEFVNKLGGSATPVSWGELYTALATGVVDGTKNATPDIISNKFNESINYGTLDRHTFLFGFYWVSDAWLNTLPEDIRTAVLDGFKHGAGVQTKFNKNQEDIANETFIKGGGSIYEPNAEERETFLFARDAMMDWYKEKYGDEWLNILMEAVDKAKAEAGVN